ncbi:MAG: M1 family metallopeptidase [Burkholderiales bacterium]|nr:M1 family metallopeptidase [Burkholderiales bacterium]
MPRPIARLAAALATLLLAAAASAAAPPLRLPDTVRPLAYHLALTVDPATPGHSGEVGIDVELRQPQRSLLLHAKELQIRSAWLDIGAKRWPAKASRFDAERIELRFAQPVPAGRARLVLAFTGRQQDTDLDGLFRRREGGEWYAYTQFESTSARLAFPAFDEPGWKVPWTLSLTVPQALVAVANTPVRREEPAQPGWKRVEFEPTPPLPSYLVAFAIGPLDVLDAPPAGSLPIRFLAPRGRAAQAAYAAGITARIVQRMEAYFDLPHPYTKLDNVALAVPAHFGAMENAGLVTYAAPLMLAPPGEDTPQFQRTYVSLAAHEIAHQWFGNLVTMAWWDDLWLNESFASWLGDRIVDELMPQWQWRTSVPQARARAMQTDRLLSARQVRQPVTSDDDFGSLWDPITYEKGQVVLAMLEQWLGPERFRDSVRRYVNKHAWGHATAEDFMQALGAQDPALPEVLRSFTQQPGIPRVAVSLQCGEGPPQLLLRQSRLLALAPARAPGPAPLWRVPMLIRTPAGLTRHLLDAPEARVALPDTECPAWVQANAGGAGYYRASYAAEHWQALLARTDLPLNELLALADDALGLSEAGDLPLPALLDMAERLARHPARQVAAQAATVLRRARPTFDAAHQDDLARRWQAAFGERARQLGWAPHEGEDEDTRLLRAVLVEAVAIQGADATLRAQARGRVDAWLANGTPLDPQLRGALLASAAVDGDEALFDALLAAARRAPERSLRSELHAALGHFRAPRLAQRARELLLMPGLEFNEVAPAVMRAHNRVPALREGLLQFLQARQAEIVKRMGRDEPATLPTYLDDACSEDEAQRIERLFTPQAARYQGGRRALAQVLERVRICAAWQQRAALR